MFIDGVMSVMMLLMIMSFCTVSRYINMITMIMQLTFPYLIVIQVIYIVTLFCVGILSFYVWGDVLMYMRNP